MRTCGDCVVCCVYLRIDDEKLQKNGMHHCPYVTLAEQVEDGLENGAQKNNKACYTGLSPSGNCSIYTDLEKRPECCAGYNCLWLLGFGDEEDRPDKSLILFDCVHGIENAVEAKPLKEGQEDTEEGKQTIKRMSRSCNRPVIVTNFYERRIKRVVGRGV